MKKRGKKHVGIGSPRVRGQELKSIKQDGGTQYRRVPQPSFPQDYPTTPTYLPACLTAYLSTCLTYLPTYQPTNLSVYLPNNPPTYLPTNLPIHLCAQLLALPTSHQLQMYGIAISIRSQLHRAQICIPYDAIHSSYSVNGHNETGRALLASCTTETLIHVYIYIYVSSNSDRFVVAIRLLQIFTALHRWLRR